jgi:hypothetical protein
VVVYLKFGVVPFISCEKYYEICYGIIFMSLYLFENTNGRNIGQHETLDIIQSNKPLHGITDQHNKRYSKKKNSTQYTEQVAKRKPHGSDSLFYLV